MQRILVIDDESSIRRIIKLNLESHGFSVLEASSGAQGIEQVRESRPSVIVLDLGLPDCAGMTVLKEIRSWSKVPIIVLTVRDDESAKVSLLESGADDYITKPFSVPELVARVRVCLRNHPEDGAASPIFESSHGLKVDLIEHKVFLAEKEVKLTVTEFNLLRILVKHAGRIVAQEAILNEVWGKSAIENTHYLRIYIGQLRKKLESDPSKPQHILTEPGVGYRIV
jgi:two-component system, OmpR family, KDP operon response regulator KdpE